MNLPPIVEKREIYEEDRLMFDTFDSNPKSTTRTNTQTVTSPRHDKPILTVTDEDAFGKLMTVANHCADNFVELKLINKGSACMVSPSPIVVQKE